jgi:hypothetical protein
MSAQLMSHPVLMPVRVDSHVLDDMQDNNNAQTRLLTRSVLLPLLPTGTLACLQQHPS